MARKEVRQSLVKRLWQARFLGKALTAYVILLSVGTLLFAVTALAAFFQIQAPLWGKMLASVVFLAVLTIFYVWMRFWPDLLRVFVSIERHLRLHGERPRPKYWFIEMAHIGTRILAVLTPISFFYLWWIWTAETHPFEHWSLSWAVPFVQHVGWIGSVGLLTLAVVRTFCQGRIFERPRVRQALLQALGLASLALILAALIVIPMFETRFEGGPRYHLWTLQAFRSFTDSSMLSVTWSPWLLLLALFAVIVPSAGFVLSRKWCSRQGGEGWIQRTRYAIWCGAASASLLYVLVGVPLLFHKVVRPRLGFEIAPGFGLALGLVGTALLVVGARAAVRRVPKPLPRFIVLFATAVVLLGSSDLTVNTAMRINTRALGGTTFVQTFGLLYAYEEWLGRLKTREWQIGQKFGWRRTESLTATQTAESRLVSGLSGTTGKASVAVPSILVLGMLVAFVWWLLSDGLGTLCDIGRNFRQHSNGLDDNSRGMKLRVFNLWKYLAWSAIVGLMVLGLVVLLQSPENLCCRYTVQDDFVAWIGKGVLSWLEDNVINFILLGLAVSFAIGLLGDLISFAFDWEASTRRETERPHLRFVALRSYLRIWKTLAGLVIVVLLALSIAVSGRARDLLMTYGLGETFSVATMKLWVIGLAVALSVFLWFVLAFLAELARKSMEIEANTRFPGAATEPSRFFGAWLFVRVQKGFATAGAVAILIGGLFGLLLVTHLFDKGWGAALTVVDKALGVALGLAGLALLAHIFYVVMGAIPDLVDSLLAIEANVRASHED